MGGGGLTQKAMHYKHFVTLVIVVLIMSKLVSHPEGQCQYGNRNYKLQEGWGGGCSNSPLIIKTGELNLLVPLNGLRPQPPQC